MMNTAQKQWIRRIHVAKTKLNLDDESYRALLTEPTEKPNTFFSKDKNQIEKFPLSDFFSRLQSTLGDISFYFFLFSFIRVVIRFKFVTNITQAPCIFVS